MHVAGSADYASNIVVGVNRLFGAYREPWQVASITTTAVLSSIWLWNFLSHDDSVWKRTKEKVFRLMKMIPIVRKQIDDQMVKTSAEFEEGMAKRIGDLAYNYALPNTGLSHEEILHLVDKHLERGEYDWRGGQVSGAVYGFNAGLLQLVKEVYGKTSYTNPLHPDLFPGVCKMEAEVVRMVCSLFQGDENTCGTMTTGGTESIVMACKAYRDYAREMRGVTRPNMVLPKTAHAAFDKAAQYFNIALRYVDVDAQTFEVNLKALKSAINSNTIMLVGSAPNFPYGTMDDIEAIAAMGLKYNIPVHVDACLGSFLIAFANTAGYKVRPFNFTVKGVTSISVDTHKYGFAPKGTSVIMYSDAKYRNFQYSVTTDWPGGVYASPTLNGSRAGGNIAVCWATMMNYGARGYLEATKRILDTARYIEQAVRKEQHIFVFGKPATSVIALGSKDFDIFLLSGLLCELGWNLNILQFPSGMHLCVTDMHTAPGIADKFINDLHKAIAEIMKNPQKPVEGKMAVYGMAQSLPDRSIVGEVTRCYLNSMYKLSPAAATTTTTKNSS